MPRPSRKHAILEALARELESNPGERITTAGLARAVGVSEAALYRHFPSKARIFEGLIAFAEELRRGAAIVTATHDIAEAVEFDQVLLRARRVVALGRGRDVLTPDRLMETFGIVIQDPHEEHAGRFTVAEVAHGGPQTIDTRCQEDPDACDE